MSSIFLTRVFSWSCILRKQIEFYAFGFEKTQSVFCAWSLFFFCNSFYFCFCLVETLVFFWHFDRIGSEFLGILKNALRFLCFAPSLWCLFFVCVLVRLCFFLESRCVSTNDLQYSNFCVCFFIFWHFDRIWAEFVGILKNALRFLCFAPPLCCRVFFRCLFSLFFVFVHVWKRFEWREILVNELQDLNSYVSVLMKFNFSSSHSWWHSRASDFSSRPQCVLN